MNRQDAEVAKGKGEPGAELDRLAHRVIGAAIGLTNLRIFQEVHRILGPGLLESVYEEAVCVELELIGVPFARQAPVSVEYKCHRVGEARLDLLVGERLVVELKAASHLTPVHVAQLLSYLKITQLRVGLLINFNVLELRTGIKRLIYTP